MATRLRWTRLSSRSRVRLSCPSPSLDRLRWNGRRRSHVRHSLSLFLLCSLRSSSYSPIPSAPLTRPSTTVVAPPDNASFLIGSKDKSYRHQYSNIYFVRLRALRQYVEKQAQRRWSEVTGASIWLGCRFCQLNLHWIGNPVFVPRVLDVEKGKLCFVIGTVYLEMPLKPNVLEDIARDVSAGLMFTVSPTGVTTYFSAFDSCSASKREVPF